MLGSFVANPLLTSHPRTVQPSNSSTATKSSHKADVSSGTQSILARTTLALEYASLRHLNHCPLGMYVIPSPKNLFVWDAVLFIHQGYYAGAVLRFRLTFPDDYPDKIPAVQFLTDIFHPLIDQKGHFNLSPHFRPWKPKEHHVYNILYDVKAAFKKYRLDQVKEADSWNREAHRLYVRALKRTCMILTKARYHESTSSFSALATQSSQLTRSESALYDEDHPSLTGQATEGLTFQKLSPDKLHEYRQKLGLRQWVDGQNES